MVLLQKNKQIIRLYDYQKKAFKKLVLVLRHTHRALMVMATGLGKTIVSIEVVKYFITPKDTVLFLCHDNGILNNAFEKYKIHMGNSYTYTKFYGDKKDWEADKYNFVFATFQSMYAHLQDPKVKKKLFSPKHFTFVVVDESHHSQAETFADVINYFKSLYKLGMTATPDREDEENIRDIFGTEIVKILLPEAIAKGWLTPVDYRVLSDGIDSQKIAEICKEVLQDNVRLTEKQINDRIFIKFRTQEQTRIIQEHSDMRKSIIFCKNIEHIHDIKKYLPSSATLHSKQSTAVNDRNFELFENGDVRHILVVDKFNEGIDVPDTELLGFLRDTDSERIFFQQLGRGLRRCIGKKNVLVLDFVGNINRIRQLVALAEEIERIARTSNRMKSTIGNALHIEGKGFKFDFSDEVVNLLSVFEKIEESRYPTWEEASEATLRLGIKNGTEYAVRYKEDFRLTSSPENKYLNFPGWDTFLKREPPFYLTCAEASLAAIKLGIKTTAEYQEKYKKDKKLPYGPHEIYDDFPGYRIFLGGKPKEFYATWQETANAAKKLDITSNHQYKKVFKRDAKLPSHPQDFYDDFPGWTIFFGKKKKISYKTWQKASRAAIKLNIVSSKTYIKEYTKNKLLPSNPSYLYKDFPGWKIFLGKE